MKITNNAKVVYEGPSEGVYIYRREGKVARTEHAHEAVLLDFDADDNLIGVEVLATTEDLHASLGDQIDP